MVSHLVDSTLGQEFANGMCCVFGSLVLDVACKIVVIFCVLINIVKAGGDDV